MLVVLEGLEMYAKLPYIVASAKEGQMLAFNNPADAVDEPNDARMQFRTKARVKETIQRAAALSGVDDSAFMISAAYRSAMETIKAHEQTQLQAEDFHTFFTALDAPATPTAALQAAHARYKGRTQSTI
jgi:uncharacterized protein (DUF1778 family)